MIGNFSINSKDISLLEVLPRTGRTHQIRVHLASIGHPIIGDKLYGVKLSDAARQMLHATSLEFDAPDGGHLKIEAPLPEDFNERLNGMSR